MRTQHSAPALAGALLALAGVLTGCGIRPTSVPVDAGAAPSRVSCTVPSTASPTATVTVTATRTAAAADRNSQTRTERQQVGQDSVQIYLVCSDEVTAVRRTLPAPIGGTSAADRLAAARTLLGQLQTKPDENESVAGFTTDVPGDLDVSGPRRGDPATALRLSDEQNALPTFALAQIVCTFARTAAASGASDGSVVLGFSDGGAARRFSCTSDLRTRPEVSQTTGTAVR